MWKHTGWVILHNFSYKQWWNNDIYLCLKLWSGSKYIWCNALAGLMDQPVLDSNIKFTVSLTRAATATLRALLFHCSRRGLLLCVCVCFMSWVIEKRGQLSVYRQPLPPCPRNRTCRSVLIPDSLLSTARLSLTCRTSLVSLSLSRPAWVSPLLHHYTSLSALGLRTCIIPVKSHRTGIIYSSITDCFEKCLLRAELGRTDNTPTHKPMQGCKHSLQLQISGSNMR